jgi:hypothetical protein
VRCSRLRALKRALKAERLDIHALADAIEAPVNGKKFSEEEAKEIYRRGVADGRREAERNQPLDFTSVDEPSWHEVACSCRDRNSWRDEREQQFVLDMVRRTVRDVEPTEKQAGWLRKIYARRS